MTKTWTTILEQDPDDAEGLIITFPDDLLEEAGWKVGDTLVWQVQEDKSVIITKK